MALKAEQKDKVARRGYRKVLDYQAVFNTPQGRAVLHDLMAAHNVLQSTFTGDANSTLVNEGERRVILRILTLMKANPQNLLERIEEHEKQME